jgi:deoxycytidine triphosphate deaminase
VISSVLSDGTIRRLVDEGRIKIDPWDPGMVQPASVDLRLGRSFRVFHNHRIKAVDLAAPPSRLTEHVEVQPDGEFVIHPTEFVLGRTAETVELPDDVVARIEGKALALDTPVPTPRGWSTMGDLRIGDEVFDAWGMPTEVIATTEVMEDRECRELVFSDGTTIVADVDHLWESWTKRSRARRWPPEILTTRAIEQSLKVSATEYNHHVARCDPVRYYEKDLPVDPYVFGAWIGDGTSLREIALAGHAVEYRRRLRYRIGGASRERDPVSGRFTANAYLQASVTQRQALLAGLMDTDGYVDRWGRCELTTVRQHLAEQYRELLASLGFKPVVSVKTATLHGKDCGLKYDVTFTPDEPVFRLPRKLARQKLHGRFCFDRAIVDVRPIRSVPVRCIQVAHPRGLFLVSRSFIPTHNSSLGRLGLIVHATAGFVDPGFRGSLTLEITNFNSVPIVLRPDLPIAQLSFMALDRPAERPYGHPDLGSHYHGQTDATESRYEGGPAGRPLRK